MLTFAYKLNHVDVGDVGVLWRKTTKNE
jgi:hypothetical protein